MTIYAINYEFFKFNLHKPLVFNKLDQFKAFTLLDELIPEPLRTELPLKHRRLDRKTEIR